MKTSELRGMKAEDLQTKLGDLQKKLFELRCQHVTEKLENCHAMSNCRKDIAKVKTIINEMKVQ